MQDTNLKLECVIDSIVTFQTFAYQSNFIYKNEYHNCWMLYLVQSGELEFSFSSRYRKNIIVPANSVFIQPPNSDYSYKATSEEGTQAMCLGFSCESEALKLIASTLITPSETELSYLTMIQNEIKDCFEPAIQADGSVTLSRHTLLQPFGGEQLIKNYLEILCIRLVRDRSIENERSHLSAEQTDQLLFQRITNYYTENITSYQTVPALCEKFNLGEAHLQRIFRQRTGMAAIEFFFHMRIQAAKKMMREEGTGLHETAERMGYHTTHYFSKQFKQVEGIAPTKYLKRLQNTDKDLFKKEFL